VPLVDHVKQDIRRVGPAAEIAVREGLIRARPSRPLPEVRGARIQPCLFDIQSERRIGLAAAVVHLLHESSKDGWPDHLPRDFGVDDRLLRACWLVPVVHHALNGHAFLQATPFRRWCAARP
jgi:hypothetical protein